MPRRARCPKGRGINDNPQTMLELMRALIKILEIMDYLRGRISGYVIPTYAVELLSGKGKVPLLPQYLMTRIIQSTSLEVELFQNTLFS